MTRNFTISIGEYYHVYNRGTDKRIIFLDDLDRQRFVKLLYLCNSEKRFVFRDIPISRTYGYDRGETIVEIGAYCLMNNHFHLLLKEKKENGVSVFMQKLLTAYSKYFNTKYQRTGILFEGKFKAKHADTDEYLKYLFAYIHLNPVKIIEPEWKETGISDREKASIYLDHYKYSSYLEYKGISRQEGKIINHSVFPEYFNTSAEFEDLIQDWLSFSTT